MKLTVTERPPRKSCSPSNTEGLLHPFSTPRSAETRSLSGAGLRSGHRPHGGHWDNFLAIGVAVLTAAITAGCVSPPKQTPPPPQKHAHPATAAKTSFYLLPNTASPTGKYALAWGIRGNNSVDWNRIVNGDNTYLDSLLGSTGMNVEDYLVNQNSKTVIGTLSGVRYWAIANRSENNGAMQAAWRADEHLLLVVHQGKWTYQSFDAVRVNHNAITHRNDIGSAMTAAVRSWLNQHHAAQYQPVKNQLVISIGAPVFNANQATYVVDYSAEIPKALSGFTSQGKATFRIHNGAHGAVSVTLDSLVEN